MTTFAADMLVRYAVEGIGYVSGPRMNMFEGSDAVIPEGDGPFLSVIETGGTGPLRTHNRIVPPAYTRPSAEVIVRGKSLLACQAMAAAAYGKSIVRNASVNGTYYREIDPVQEPNQNVGPDAKGLPRVAFNIQAVRRPT